MSFFEQELCRFIGFQGNGGQTFNTSIVATQSGQEQRNRNWLNPRSEYSLSLVTPQSAIGATDAYIEAVRTFWIMVAGMQDGFRYFDPLDCLASNQSMADLTGGVWQLQKTYSLGGRTYVRTITKPVTSSVLDYTGVAINPSNPPYTPLSISGGTIVSTDHTTGKVTLSGVSGTPHATFSYHIPVRFTSNNFDPETVPSSSSNRIIKWNSLGLIEVRPPNY